MGNLSSLGSVFNQPNSLGILPLQTEQTAQFYVDLLRPYVDVIVILSHLGLDEDETMVQGTTGIDIVAGGHNHIVVDPPQVLQDCSADPSNPGYVWEVDPNVPENPNTLPPDDAGPPRPGQPPVPVSARVQAAQRPHHALGGLLEVRRARSTSPVERSRRRPRRRATLPTTTRTTASRSSRTSYQIFPITTTIPEDPVIVDLLQPYQTSLDVQSDLDILAGFSPNGAKRIATEGGDSPLGNLVATSMWLQLGVQTDFSLTNSTGIRTDLNPGPVAISDIFNIFPFDNTTTKMELSGPRSTSSSTSSPATPPPGAAARSAQIAGARVRLNCSGCDPNLRPDTGGPCMSDSDCTSGAVGRVRLPEQRAWRDGYLPGHPVRRGDLHRPGDRLRTVTPSHARATPTAAPLARRPQAAC